MHALLLFIGTVGHLGRVVFWRFLSYFKIQFLNISSSVYFRLISINFRRDPAPRVLSGNTIDDLVLLLPCVQTSLKQQDAF
jgi:hypothetical protein